MALRKLPYYQRTRHFECYTCVLHGWSSVLHNIHIIIFSFQLFGKKGELYPDIVLRTSSSSSTT